MGKYSDGNSVYLDIGGHIGPHALAVAAANNGRSKVWSVEPLTHNLVLAYKSALLNGFEGRMRFLQNAVDFRPGIVNMRGWHGMTAGMTAFYPGNEIGDEMIQNPDVSEEAEAVTMKDVVEEIVRNEYNETSLEPINIVVKLDIEMMECKAILGSLEIW